MYSYSLSSSSTSSSSLLQSSSLTSTDLFLQTSSVFEKPERCVHVNPAFLHLQWFSWQTSPSCICISQGGWLPQVLGQVWSSLGSTLSHLLPISSQSPLVLAKLDWALCHCFTCLVADSGHGEPLMMQRSLCNGVPVNACGNIDRFRATVKDTINECLIACGSIHEGHEWFSDDSRGRHWEIFMCLAALLCEQFCRFANEGAKISIKSYFTRSFFFLSVFSSSEVLAKIYFHSSKLLLQLAGLGEKREEPVKPTCFMSKATSVLQTPQTNHSVFFQFFARWGVQFGALLLFHKRPLKLD